MKKHVLVGLVAFAPALVMAQAQEGMRELTITGSGSSDSDFDSTAFGLSVEYGHFMRDNLEAGLRQSLNIADNPDDTSWNGATRIYADYYFGSPSDFQPYAGGNFGGAYGNGVDETFFAGPEVGAKYYVKSGTFIDAKIEYQIFFDSGDELENNYDDGAWVYSVGVGYNF